MVDKECIRCKRTIKHYAKGYCKSCYYFTFFNDKNKQSFDNWKVNNPNYFKSYYINHKPKVIEEINGK